MNPEPTSRRQFISQTGVGLGAAALVSQQSVAAADATERRSAPPKEVHGPVPVVLPVPGAPFLHAGPMIGHVTDNTAQLWAKASNEANLSFKISRQPDLTECRLLDGPLLQEATSFTGQVRADGLQPATRYYCTPMLNGEPALARPYPSFVTAPAPGAGGKLRVAFGSCVGDRGYQAAAAFGEMAERKNFDLLLMLGDNHYGNTTNPDRLRDYYHMLRIVNGFTHIIREVPTYAIWDDHDFGQDNSDGTSKGKEDSLRVFQQWWANPAYGEPDNPGCYYQFSRGDVDFFMTDVRYHRTPNKAVDDGTKTMLGARQLAWLKEALSASKAKFKIVASGSEWQTRTQPDGWSSFARERQEIFDHITGHKIDGVVLLSGDRHFTAGYQVQGRHLEFTSGPFGSSNATQAENPERFTGADVGKLWVVIDIDTAADAPHFHYEIWQAGGGLLERRELRYEQVCGRQEIETSAMPLVPHRMEPKRAR